MSSTPYADKFVAFQEALNAYGNAEREFAVRPIGGGEDGGLALANKVDKARVNVLRHYNDVLTALQHKEAKL